MSGLKSYQKGLLAEGIVEQAYCREGASVIARRYRSGAGEIDLILRKGLVVIFVEVKSARTLERAAESLGQRQIARLMQAGEIWLAAKEPQGTNCRFDVALVDDRGRLRRIENAFLA